MPRPVRLSDGSMYTQGPGDYIGPAPRRTAGLLDGLRTPMRAPADVKPDPIVVELPDLGMPQPMALDEISHPAVAGRSGLRYVKDPLAQGAPGSYVRDSRPRG